ncbi:hypothetical protein PWG14_18575 (plasmid) [Chromobacterium amazonense]|uniref:hypothetical protein n=1 Tax=Chromobacterium amazonense TaxID=1382803 RepID=UPI00237E35C4|nr:hypothetical protein [Chromobacterium amazonense]MDE1714511.1 hypothetical protein [Chromobacterium amazonense]
MNQAVTVHQAAEANTQTVARAKPQYTELTDSLGRVIKLRQLSPVQESRLILAVGPEHAANAVYLNTFAVPAARVAYIDADPYGFPTTLAEIEMVLNDLDTEGMHAIIDHMVMKNEEARAALAKMLDAEKEAAKN